MPGRTLGRLKNTPFSRFPTKSAKWQRGSARKETQGPLHRDVPLSDTVEDWPDERLWDELVVRLPDEAAAKIVRGPALGKSIAPLRSASAA